MALTMGSHLLQPPGHRPSFSLCSMQQDLYSVAHGLTTDERLSSGSCLSIRG